MDFTGLLSYPIGRLVVPSDYSPPEEGVTFYRYEGIGEVWEQHFKLLKETPCGYWIIDYHEWEKKRWVSKTGIKRYAYPTRRQALESYIKRKEKQIHIMRSTIDLIKAGLSIIEKEFKKESSL